jgi:hypothetical protein
MERGRSEGRAVERERARERSRAAEQRRAGERERAAERRQSEQRRAAEREQRGKSEQAERRQREERNQAERRQREERTQAEKGQRTEDRKRGERRKAEGRDGQRQVRHEEARRERKNLSAEQRTRLRSSFGFNRDRDRDRISKVRFTKRIGHRIPRHVVLYPVPAAVFAVFPYYRDYSYVILDDDICIIDPVTYEIVDVIEDVPYETSPRPQMALSLSDTERTLVLGSIPSDFPDTGLRLRLALGGEIPDDLELHRFARVVVDEVPKLRDFRFIVAQDQVVIVEPASREIALVLER